MRTSLYILAVCALSLLLTQYALGTFFHSHKRKVPRSIRTIIALAAVIPLIFLAGLGSWHTFNTALHKQQLSTVEDSLNRQTMDVKNLVNDLRNKKELAAIIANPQDSTFLQTKAIEQSLRSVMITNKEGIVIASPLQPELVGTPSPYASYLPTLDQTVSGTSTTSSQKNITILAMTSLDKSAGDGFLIVAKDFQLLSNTRYGAMLVSPEQLSVPINSYKLDYKANSASLIESTISEPLHRETTYRILEGSWYMVRAQKFPVLTVSQPLYLIIISPTQFQLYIAWAAAALIVLLLAYIVWRKRIRLKEVPGVMYLLIIALAISGACIQIARKGFYNRYTSRIDKVQPVLSATLGFYGSAVHSSQDVPVTMNLILTSPGSVLGKIQAGLVIDPPGSAEVQIALDENNCPIRATKDHENIVHPLSFLCVPPQVPFAKQEVILGTLTVTPKTSKPFTVRFDPDRSLIQTNENLPVYTAYPPVTFISK